MKLLIAICFYNYRVETFQTCVHVHLVRLYQHISSHAIHFFGVKKTSRYCQFCWPYKMPILQRCKDKVYDETDRFIRVFGENNTVYVLLE